MAKPDRTPSQEIVAKALAETIITDVRGRKIKLRKPPIIAHYKIVEIVGESAKNEVYMGMVLPIIYVVEIDGVAVPSPGKKSELEALIQRLDEDGVNAVVPAVLEHFGASADPEKDRAEIKN